MCSFLFLVGMNEMKYSKEQVHTQKDSELRQSTSERESKTHYCCTWIANIDVLNGGKPGAHRQNIFRSLTTFGG